jgi:filamentous hemagglutinin family protein
MLLPICDQTQPYFVTLKSFNLGLVSFVVTTAILSFSVECAWTQQSEVKPDNTLGTERTLVKPNVDIKGQSSDLIEGGASRGVNLFHSFEEFNIGEGNRVYFNNPSGIERIFSRVTGHYQSVILGTLGVLGNADLFLLNPNGIMFGQNAALDLKGSFLATTASSVIFKDGTEFSAVNPSPEALLTVSIPIGLQFRETPGAIVNQSQTTFEISRGIDFGGLKVQPNKTLALVGGDITLQGGFLTANGGRIEVGSVGSPAIVSLKPIEKGWMLGYEGVQNFGDIQLIESSTISPQIVEQFGLLGSFPIYSQINANGDTSVLEGGDVQLQGRRVILADGSRIFAAANAGTQPGGSLTFNASESVEMMGNDFSGVFALLSTSVLREGNGGNIVINTKKLTLGSLAGITSEAFKKTTGRVGDIILNVTESVEISNDSYISSQTSGFGDGGTLRINTKSLHLSNGSTLSAETLQVRGGNIILNIQDILQLRNNSNITTNSNGIADGGNITINSRFILGSQNSDITANSLGGRGGAINIAAESIDLGNSSQITTKNKGFGDGGTLRINTSSLYLTNGSTLSAETLQGQGGNISLNIQDTLQLYDNSKITTNSQGMGDGGNITINSRFILGSQNSDITANSLGGRGGAINIAAESIDLGNSSQITTKNKGFGDGGTLRINTSSLYLTNGSTLSAETLQGQGGNISLNIQDTLQLYDNSKITTNSQGMGDGGNITINSRFILGSQNSDITANSLGGRGGAINIAAESIDLGNSSQITTKNEGFGDGGTLRINTSSLYLTNGSTLSAETLQGQGGNLILKVQDTLQLRNNSNITTNSQGMGDGGNITINSRFILGSQNSDITANSFGARGGAINITATGVFGLLVQDGLTSGNDITAFSEKGAALNGIIDLNTPEVDPSQGLIELPTTVVDPTALVAQNPCQKSTESQLTITGRGGLPPNITEDFNNNAVQVDLVKPVPTQNRPIESKTIAPPPAPIEPAQGWIFNEKGEVVLTAYNSTVTEPQRRNEKSASCSTP